MFMNSTTVNTNLQQAVLSFWETPVNFDLSGLDLSPLSSIIKEVSENIIAASQMKDQLEAIAKRNLSLKECCYLIVQSRDQQTGNSTLTRIQESTEKTKAFVAYIFQQLAVEFVQVDPNNLKEMTLLFSIPHLSQQTLTTPTMTTQLSREDTYRKFLAMRSNPNLSESMQKQLDEALRRYEASLLNIQIENTGT